jgi:hypothetical protein
MLIKDRNRELADLAAQRKANQPEPKRPSGSVSN